MKIEVGTYFLIKSHSPFIFEMWNKLAYITKIEEDRYWFTGACIFASGVARKEIKGHWCTTEERLKDGTILLSTEKKEIFKLL